jgi:hypothetical protein
VAFVLIVFRVIVKYRHVLDERRLQRPDGVTTLIMAFTNPDMLRFMPWTEDAYEGVSDSSVYPNQDVVWVTLVRLFEDISEFALQIAFITVSGADAFTIVNLSLTIVMMFYLIVGKMLANTLFGGRSTDPHKQSGIELRREDHVPTAAKPEATDVLVSVLPVEL